MKAKENTPARRLELAQMFWDKYRCTLPWPQTWWLCKTVQEQTGCTYEEAQQAVGKVAPELFGGNFLDAEGVLHQAPEEWEGWAKA